MTAWKIIGTFSFGAGNQLKRREVGVGFAVRKQMAAKLDEEPVPTNDWIMTMILPLKCVCHLHQCVRPNNDQHRGGKGRVLK